LRRLNRIENCRECVRRPDSSKGDKGKKGGKAHRIVTPRSIENKKGEHVAPSEISGIAKALNEILGGVAALFVKLGRSFCCIYGFACLISGIDIGNCPASTSAGCP
jgi:hypothetical protein